MVPTTVLFATLLPLLVGLAPHPRPRPMKTLPLFRTLAVALFCAICCLALAQAASAQGGFVGMSSQDVLAGSPSYRADNLSRQRSAGVEVLRQNFDWAAIERSPGHFELAFYDQYVADSARAGMQILPVLFNAPRFYARGGRYLRLPRNPRAMGRFAAVLVNRYGPNGSFWRSNPGVPRQPIHSWQVWNEPNLVFYNSPRPSASRYAKLLRTVSRYIRKADRGAEVVTAGIPPSKLRTAISLGRFIRGMYRAHARGSFNTIAVNAYAIDSRDLSRTIRGVRRLMRRYRDRRSKIWITELGWGTGGPKHRFNVGFAQQGARITSTFNWIAQNRARYNLRGVVYFQWRDQKPYPPGYKDLWGLHTGLLNVDGVAKPALGAFRSAAQSLR
jgi:hypothetical protein